MKIRKAIFSDIPQILEIYNSARQYMRESGNMNQWSGSYPDIETVKTDIENNNLHVCVDDSNIKILSVFFYKFADDPTYAEIFDGCWANDLPYGVIHRIAVEKNSHGIGVADFCYSYAFSLCKNLKIDTHRDNIPMQKSLLKNNFKYCGIVYIADGSERLAFQKTI